LRRLAVLEDGNATNQILRGAMRNLPKRIVLLLAAGRAALDRCPAGARAAPASGGEAKQQTVVVFKNVKVFDGKSDRLTDSTTVLVPATGSRRSARAIA
jgi:hypothetical protein